MTLVLTEHALLHNLRKSSIFAGILRQAIMAVQVQHLNKHIGKQHVLSDVSLTISDGEVVGLLGPNGAGKSTLMKILVGVWDADRPGKSRLAAAPTASSLLAVPATIGYLPEQNPLYDEMYVREYLLFFVRLRLSSLRGKAQMDCVEQLITRVGLTTEANKRIGELSKGYKQRVGLAQALIGDPELLILDEPTTGLDPNQLEDIRALIRSVGTNRMVILSTHILQEVAEMCSRVIIIDHGCIRADRLMADIGGVKQLEKLFRDVTK